jgi:hypothetical protein
MADHTVVQKKPGGSIIFRRKNNEPKIPILAG